MSTRGAIGIRYKEIDKIGYNHCDSYFSGLGKELLLFLSNSSYKKLINLYNKIIFNNDKDNDTWNWTKHTFNKEFKNYNKFLINSLFCEYAYIINLDSKMLEIYIGFNKNPNEKGRYANIKYDINDRYNEFYGVKLYKEIPLQDLFEEKYIIKEENKKEDFYLK